MSKKCYTFEATVTEDHIRHASWASWHRPDDDRADAIVTAIRDAGIDDVKIEIHLNLIPPNHDWAIWINGKRYAMTYHMRSYYDYFRIEHGKRTEPAVIQFSDVDDTVDVRILPPDNRPEWEKRGLSYHQYREEVLLGGKKPKQIAPLWMQQNALPKEIQAKRIAHPQQDALLQRLIPPGSDEE